MRSPLPIRLAALATASLVAACGAEHRPPGARPVVASGALTSGLVYRPLPAERLADPGMRAAVEGCERAGKEHCREYAVPGEKRQDFTKGADPAVVATFAVGGAAPGLLVAGCDFIDPAGIPERVVDIPGLTVPPGLPSDQTLTLTCPMELSPTTPEGAWRVELSLDGRRAAVLPFRVLAAAGPGPARR
jgi:hypothetical protein